LEEADFEVLAAGDECASGLGREEGGVLGAEEGDGVGGDGEEEDGAFAGVEDAAGDFECDLLGAPPGRWTSMSRKAVSPGLRLGSMRIAAVVRWRPVSGERCSANQMRVSSLRTRKGSSGMPLLSRSASGI